MSRRLPPLTPKKSFALCKEPDFSFITHRAVITFSNIPIGQLFA